MHFTKIRIAGFKSFVDATELPIEPGVTGIVGPNGCGKSNLVEALRWAMGESSARRLRGEGMEDVIFAGSAERPSRNLAEVVLSLDNGDRTAPAGFNDSDQIEIVRRIARDQGSDYRINGRSVRARDVQLLFQDNASGAGSAALVSQGRVSQLITAKPAERRQLLEEAAGITGLHSRRHEAELKLKAADENLLRLDDALGGLKTQLAALRRQSRQANRYRSLSEAIRRTEAVVLHARWQAAEAAIAVARAAHAANERVVAETALALARATTAEAEAAERVGPARDLAAAANAALHRLVIARETLESEAARVAAEEAEAKRRLAQLEGDIARERRLAADAENALVRLAEEEAALAAAAEGDSQAAARTLLAEKRAGAERLDGELQAAQTALAAQEAERQTLTRRLAELEGRQRDLQRRRDENERSRAQIAAEPGADLEPLAAAVAAAELALEQAVAAADAAEGERRAAEAAQGPAREKLQAAEARLAKLKAEADGLRALIGAGGNGKFPPALDAIEVEAGYEAALAAAFGDDLAAPLAPGAPVHWTELPAVAAAPLPTGATALAEHVRAPGALARRLAHIGLVADAATGADLAPSLAPGQQLVTRAGGQWRWDGLVVGERAPTAAAIKLAQRNRLAELRPAIAEAEPERTTAAEALAQLRGRFQAAETADAAARQARRNASSALEAARCNQARAAQAAQARTTRLAGLDATVGELSSALGAAAQELSALGERLAALPDPATPRQQVTELRTRLTAARAEEGQARGALDALEREAAARQRRLAALTEEQRGWRERATGAGERVVELDGRAGEAQAAIAALADRPREIASRRAALRDEIAEAERWRAQTGDALARSETAQREAARELKAAGEAAIAARETRARAEGDVRAGMAAVEALAERIQAQLSCRPEAVAAIAGLEPGAPPPDLADTERRLERLLAERESIGPVNLRAEQEATELDQEIMRLIAEREDVAAAVARLRQGIAALNREARERLLGSFETVNSHFQRLFQRLFGGGTAKLELTEADDPLASGLEILASPPGKRLQYLGLLSGGEQALTALAALFAVFLTNPAPICVLDEVDAALDDANVDRFCSLLEELATEGTTRFLVITHHRMTMARVDRLYGVTMPERGVSRVVSVDLERAVALRRQAAE